MDHDLRTEMNEKIYMNFDICISVRGALYDRVFLFPRPLNDLGVRRTRRKFRRRRHYFVTITHNDGSKNNGADEHLTIIDDRHGGTSKSARSRAL